MLLRDRGGLWCMGLALVLRKGVDIWACLPWIDAGSKIGGIDCFIETLSQGEQRDNFFVGA